jgi:hypothetical protein
MVVTSIRESMFGSWCVPHALDAPRAPMEPAFSTFEASGSPVASRWMHRPQTLGGREEVHTRSGILPGRVERPGRDAA